MNCGKNTQIEHFYLFLIILVHEYMLDTIYILLLNLSPYSKGKEKKDSSLLCLTVQNTLIFIFSMNKMDMCLTDLKLLKAFLDTK